MPRQILVTSALPYANGAIHLGHLVEYIQTDIWVRFQKSQGHDCLYFCADDTHGTPIMIRARNEGITPEELVARIHREHVADFQDFLIGFDNYHSTHSAENRQLAEEIYNNLQQAGHIAVETVHQAYCNHDAMFLPDRFIRGTCPKCAAVDQYGDSCEHCSATYSPLELRDAFCALCGEHPVAKSSEHLFFQLGHFESFLKEWTRSGALQAEMANKLEEWFASGLKNWDISRDGPYFGFAIPGQSNKFFYVWLDAPIGYMASTLNYCQRTGRSFAEYWHPDSQAEVYHFIGKDILYFHTLFWPAMLKGAGYRTPTAVFAHGFLTVNGQKMSKSRGTFLNARTYLQHLDPEYLRYYYACKLSNRVDDLDLNLDDFVQRVNADMVGKVVNLASRTAGFLHKSFSGQLCADYPEDGGLYHAFVQTGDEIAQYYENREYAKAMRAIMALADQANRYIEEHAPWNLAKQGEMDALQAVCSVAINLFRVLMTYLAPVLPQLANKTCNLLNLANLHWQSCRQPLCGTTIQPFSHLLARIDSKQIDALLAAARPQEPTKEQQKAAAVVVAPPPPQPLPSSAATLPTINLDHFAQVDLRVARIVQAELVAGADKLLKLTLDLGSLGSRTVFAGIRAAYTPESLSGRLTVVVANLAPRKMKFGLSEGMVLAASHPNDPDKSALYLLSPDSGAEPGMRIQ
ncbi:methionine--tRNA ligase [Candidatus Magnetaquicoccus inordinatus]|uniref:methionine--tRNA ligase n=1 Tax=Candidatus Magnetaquicoccus inordinatus TaxID=2496818 RepID=UPI00102C0816|nr:methionine--tRNA ligase [Candidatus Magnetaquicoccus inordinatus]